MPSSGFRSFNMHVADKQFQSTAAHFRSPAARAFAVGPVGDGTNDPVEAALSYLNQGFSDEALPGLANNDIDGQPSSFEKVTSEEMPLTGSHVVKFQQRVRGVAVYGAGATVELDKNNQLKAISTALGEPIGAADRPMLTETQALDRVREASGSQPPEESTAQLCYYYVEEKLEWKLVYIVKDVFDAKSQEDFPECFDYVINATDGNLVDKLPRTHYAARVALSVVDARGLSRDIWVREIITAQYNLIDDELNILTCDYRYTDVALLIANANGHPPLPGDMVGNPPDWDPNDISAHANVIDVAKFLQNVLKRKGIDGTGGRIVSSVRCVFKTGNGQAPWINAMWLPKYRQMVYGQSQLNGKLITLAVSKDVVAHEMFHGVINSTAKLEYKNESGALNESYCDIFGILVSNAHEPNIAKWNWEIGDDIAGAHHALRDVSNPAREFNNETQADHMSQFVPMSEDNGGVHRYSGIHNKAAYLVMTAGQEDGTFLFKPNELASIFYVALAQYLRPVSGFADSRAALVLAVRSVLGDDPRIEGAVEAVGSAFDAAGITTGSPDTAWIQGSANCALNADPPAQIHPFNSDTFILRQNMCLNFEAPFMYLLIGMDRAFLLDTGALPGNAVREIVDRTLEDWQTRHGRTGTKPLTVAHSHSHGDHAASDAQFAARSNTTVISPGLASVKAAFGLDNWPNDTATLDLGGRILDIIPCPGHEPSHIAVYDRKTQILLTGDTLYPGRLIVNDAAAYRASVARLFAFRQSHAMSHILGAHIEMTSTPEKSFPPASTHHPNEHALALTPRHLLELHQSLQAMGANVVRKAHADFIIEPSN